MVLLLTGLFFSLTFSSDFSPVTSPSPSSNVKKEVIFFFLSLSSCSLIDRSHVLIDVFMPLLPKTDSLRTKAEETRSRDHYACSLGPGPAGGRGHGRFFFLCYRRSDGERPSAPMKATMILANNCVAIESISQSYVGITFLYKLTKYHSIKTFVRVKSYLKWFQKVSALVCSIFNQSPKND